MAQRVPGTMVVRELPDTDEERAHRQRLFDVRSHRSRLEYFDRRQLHQVGRLLKRPV
jgi:hypothetical protein